MYNMLLAPHTRHAYLTCRGVHTTTAAASAAPLCACSTACLQFCLYHTVGPAFSYTARYQLPHLLPVLALCPNPVFIPRASSGRGVDLHTAALHWTSRTRLFLWHSPACFTAFGYSGYVLQALAFLGHGLGGMTSYNLLFPHNALRVYGGNAAERIPHAHISCARRGTERWRARTHTRRTALRGTAR